MAQKYLMALDYVDVQANNLLKKHAKKRPLGDLETRHRYMPTQPVLSCRTVDIDVSGTRTYRPKSSADIISEQHALIHKIYTKARNIASAPPARRSRTPRNTEENNKNSNKENKLKSVEVQGRPLTSLSQRTGSSGRNSKTSTKSNKRPKTTGNVKNAKPVNSENFMIVRADRDLIETRRSYRSITDKIHKQWKPENHDLNTGTFQRGKKQPGIQSVDSWLTFSGSQSDDAEGVIDAFADLDAQAGYYNIEGGVGSRIAQQLEKGEKVRVCINGNLQSQDLKVKKWVKEDSYIDEIEVMKGNTGNQPKKENMAKNEAAVIPLCWEDQVEGNGAKVLTPRGPQIDRTTLNLCETRPVVFQKLIPDDNGSHTGLSHYSKKEGYRVKQRKKNKPGVDGKERENKVTVVTIDSKSEEEEKKIQTLTVDEVLKQNCKSTEKQNGRQDDTEKHSVTFSMPESEENGVQDTVYSQNKINVVESVSSGSSEQGKHPKIKPSQPTFSTKYQEVDLDIIGTLSVPNGTRPLSSENVPSQQFLYTNKSGLPPRSSQGRAGSARSSRSSTKPHSAISGQQKSLGSGSVVSLGSPSYGPQNFKQNEAEYIQIAHPVKNPNPGQQQQQRKQTDFVSQGMNPELRGQRTNSGIREPVPSPELDNYEEMEQANTPVPPTVQIKPVSKPTTPALSINIPTADYTDSALNSPSHKQAPDLESTPQTRRAKDMRDEQIDQITTLLVDAIIGPNEGQQADKS